VTSLLSSSTIDVKHTDATRWPIDILTKGTIITLWYLTNDWRQRIYRTFCTEKGVKFEEDVPKLAQRSPAITAECATMLTAISTKHSSRPTQNPTEAYEVHSKTGIWTQPFHGKASVDVGRFKFNLIDCPQPSARHSPPNGALLSPHAADRSPTPPGKSCRGIYHRLTHAPNFLCSFSCLSSTCVGALKEQLRRLTSPCDLDGDKVST
jgi:hypothetical protein